jgi:hypothetical protein
LKQGELFDELVALCERKGDAEAARDLDKQLQQEIEIEKLQKEEEDRRLALKMQDEEEMEKQQLKQRLTKTHTSSASIYTSAITSKGGALNNNKKKLIDELKSNKRITNFFTIRDKENSSAGKRSREASSSSDAVMSSKIHKNEIIEL